MLRARNRLLLPALPDIAQIPPIRPPDKIDVDMVVLVTMAAEFERRPARPFEFRFQPGVDAKYLLNYVAEPCQKTGPSTRESFVSIPTSNMKTRYFVHEMVDVRIVFDGRRFTDAGAGQALRVVHPDLMIDEFEGFLD